MIGRQDHGIRLGLADLVFQTVQDIFTQARLLDRTHETPVEPKRVNVIGVQNRHEKTGVVLGPRRARKQNALGDQSVPFVAQHLLQTLCPHMLQANM